MYTLDKNARIVIELLKSYGIKKIVVSPGTTNVPIAMTVQSDNFFEVYSVVDERSAAYFATGLSYESGEPVAISCTGATASRNYLPGLTEAFYRHIPIIAITSQHHCSDMRNLVPQVTDRSVSQNDVKKVSVMLPFIKDQEDFERCEILVNEALIKATTKGFGPVHINLPVDSSYPFSNENEIIGARKIEYYEKEGIEKNLSNLKKYLKNKKLGIFIGSHRKFNKDEIDVIESFINTYDTAVFCDHTSSYGGKNKVLTGQIFDILHSNNKPDLLIDMGSIIGDYSILTLQDVETWRISEDGVIHHRFRKLSSLFDVKEKDFFALLGENKGSKHLYFDQLSKELKSIRKTDLPLSNTYISEILSSHIPNGSNLHLGILNSLRNMNYYRLDNSITSSSNVGGFGIDGPISTLIGQSMVNKDKLYFGLVGDLAFFYDMNALGIRHIKKNLRILLVNNNAGVEFRINSTLENKFGNKTDDFIAAKGHNGSAASWAKSMNFEYIKAGTKEEFNEQIDRFCSSSLNEYDKPVLFEVFTSIEDEQAAIDLIRLQ